MKKKLFLTIILALMLTLFLALSASARDLVNSWDISENEDESLMAYLYDEGDSYERPYYSLEINGSGAMKDFDSYYNEAPWYD